MDSPCARCAHSLGRSCCEVEEGEWLATLTSADVERIESQAGVPRHRFLATEVFSSEESMAYVERRPLYAGYFARTWERWTLKRKAGACVFFAPGKGCTLDAETRPSACLLYPFDFLVGNRLSLQVDRFPSVDEARASGEAACLAVQESSDWQTLAAAFNTDESQLRQLAQRIQDEVKAHRMRAKP
jgi:Fe-S-cluster containining protein